MASTGQAHENHNGAVLECSTPGKLDGRSPLVLLLQLLRSLCPIVANGRRLEESDLRSTIGGSRMGAKRLQEELSCASGRGRSASAGGTT